MCNIISEFSEDSTWLFVFTRISFTEMLVLKLQGDAGEDGAQGAAGEPGRRVNIFSMYTISLLYTHLHCFSVLACIYLLSDFFRELMAEEAHLDKL